MDDDSDCRGAPGEGSGSARNVFFLYFAEVRWMNIFEPSLAEGLSTSPVSNIQTI